MFEKNIAAAMTYLDALKQKKEAESALDMARLEFQNELKNFLLRMAPGETVVNKDLARLLGLHPSNLAVLIDDIMLLNTGTERTSDVVETYFVETDRRGVPVENAQIQTKRKKVCVYRKKEPENTACTFKKKKTKKS